MYKKVNFSRKYYYVTAVMVNTSLRVEKVEDKVDCTSSVYCNKNYTNRNFIATN